VLWCFVTSGVSVDGRRRNLYFAAEILCHLDVNRRMILSVGSIERFGVLMKKTSWYHEEKDGTHVKMFYLGVVITY
jgi:hypothetical protein